MSGARATAKRTSLPQVKSRGVNSWAGDRLDEVSARILWKSDSVRPFGAAQGKLQCNCATKVRPPASQYSSFPLYIRFEIVNVSIGIAPGIKGWNG